MATQIYCDRFSEAQFVPVRQVWSVYRVYIATRDERKENNGIGCMLKDILHGTDQPLKLAALLKMRLCFTNGRKVRAFLLSGGMTYTLLGAAQKTNYGVFIVPAGKRFEYLYEGRQLVPGTCILWDGNKTMLLSWHYFRKIFTMLPNPVSAGMLKGQGVASPHSVKTQNVSQFHQAPATGNSVKPERISPTVEKTSFGDALSGLASPTESARSLPVSSSSAVSTPAARVQTPNVTAAYVPVARILRQETLVGLVLSDGMRQFQLQLSQCINYAERGKIKNIKAVTRNGSTFLMGNGIALESLPHIQV